MKREKERRSQTKREKVWGDGEKESRTGKETDRWMTKREREREREREESREREREKQE